jgi:putative addiction module killer protein
MFEVVQFETETGHCPFAEWFNELSTQAALKVRVAIARIEAGNLGDAKSVGSGVFERRIDWGPGYRIYLGRDGDRLVILLSGGAKSRQQADIRKAKGLWADYKRRKKESKPWP